LEQETGGAVESKPGMISNVLKWGEKPDRGISNSFLTFFGTTDSCLQSGNEKTAEMGKKKEGRSKNQFQIICAKHLGTSNVNRGSKTLEPR
jgi:hypothetical protein